MNGNLEWAQDDACANSYLCYSHSLYWVWALSGDALFTESLNRNFQGWGVYLLSTIVCSTFGVLIGFVISSDAPPAAGMVFRADQVALSLVSGGSNWLSCAN